ncbi:cell division protein DivIC [Pelagirhabdus alkalitolerans]|uniref:Cell division protein DivIC n=1 Tax=Pelagirhabdus alkalitolerans TaxID=1612202 RepID=A0A1G6MJQ1_9BACI|nr:septum formation initiator family protein [Pelagirhabdus alkalitolerans]SDC55216.1 cell division protein DivIC [Pelagirhabdus alkalitolerans]
MGERKRNVTRLESTYMNQYDAHIERQKKRKRALKRRLVAFSIIALIVSFSLLTHHLNQRSIHAEQMEKLEALTEEQESLASEEESLREEIRLLEDESYVLRIAKTNYFFTDEGEIVFKLTEEDPAY